MQDKKFNDSLRLLLDIAKAMIVEKGCRATTLQEIADRSGLTKGAIYHYVKSKDELFAQILVAGLEETNVLFLKSVAEATNPVQLISSKLFSLASTQSATNQILIYLLSQKDKPEVGRILNDYYTASIQALQSWIEVGQQYGAIPAGVDSLRLAKFFTVFKYGLQVQNFAATDGLLLTEKDLTEFLVDALHLSPQ